MYTGSRITDAVDYFQRHERLPGAVSIIRTRTPERFRWRRAVRNVTRVATHLRGLDRMRIEEPIREVVLDLPQPHLRGHVVLDACQVGMDLDRGEIFGIRSEGEIRRLAFLTGVDWSLIQQRLSFHQQWDAAVQAVRVGLLGRHMARAHHARARDFSRQVPDQPMEEDDWFLASYAQQQAQHHEDQARRWEALVHSLMLNGHPNA
jgi:hypothetical protein